MSQRLSFSRWWSGVLAAALSLTGCAPAGPAATPAPTPAAFRVGVVTNVGVINDQSFNQSAWEGAQAGAQAAGGTADYRESQDAGDYITHILDFADTGYDVIITVGFALGQATVEAAQRYPAIKFIGVDQVQAEPAPNLAGLVFHEDEAGYLAGVVAAQLTRTGTIAAVLGTDLVPSVVAFKEGYALGAQATQPEITVLATYYPGSLDLAFSDPAWGAATAQQALDLGADVVFAAAGATGTGSLQTVAAQAAAQPGSVHCIGVDTDQWATVPEARSCLVTSALKLIAPGVAELIAQAKAGTFPSGNYYGDVGLAPFHDFDSALPAAAQAQLAEIAQRLRSGDLQTGYQP